MQQLQQHQLRSGHLRSTARLHHAPKRVHRKLVSVSASQQGSNHQQGSVPLPAETARTVMDLCQGGTFCTIDSSSMTPIGTPVSFVLDRQGMPILTLETEGIELRNLSSHPRCSLKVQPAAFPARALASVTLIGQLGAPLPPQEGEGAAVSSPGAAAYPLEVQKCLYFGGMDQIQTEISGEELRGAEPDLMRHDLDDLIKTWNDERAEDIYRIVSHFLNIPLVEIDYAELLWVDRLGMYVRVEAADHLDGLVVARVPFYRPVLDERDARSVITMAAQLAWEEERPYTPPVPSIFTDAAAAANN